MRLGGPLGYQILKRCFPRRPKRTEIGSKRLEPYATRIRSLLSTKDWGQLNQMTVVDFGCGYGEGAIELAQLGVRRVIGLDIRTDVLDVARRSAMEAGVADRCEFRFDVPSGLADAIISIDAFEHFGDPEAVLGTMAAMLAPGGRVFASFGPTWHHPYGGHLFSVFPWAHLVFSESALCRWRREFRDDGAESFAEVEGGLNQMTIGRFERLVDKSLLQIERVKLCPIHSVRYVHSRWTREFLTSVVDCVLVSASVPGGSLGTVQKISV